MKATGTVLRRGSGWRLVQQLGLVDRNPDDLSALYRHPPSDIGHSVRG